MRLCRLSLLSKGTLTALYVAGALAASAPAGFASSCTTQAALSAQDRSAIAAASEHVGQAVLQQDMTALHADLLQAVADQWDGIQNEAQQGAPLVKNGHLQLRNAYLLDATSNTSVADTQFFCSNATGSLTVTVTMRALPPGRYALVIADVPGSATNAQIGVVLVWDATGAAPGWKLGGLSIRQGSFGTHDGLWFWTHGRALAAAGAPWSAWYSYEAARYLLVPVDFISSPNLDKLNQEQSQIAGSPTGAFPLTLPDGARTWKIENLRLDTSLHEADLGVTYESLGISDPAAARTEAIAVLSALLKAHPELRQDFHGLWAYASKDGKATPVLELPMAQIP
jgi:hypothetical protein